MRPKKITVNDKMQQGYVYYLTEPEGQNFAPDFKPELTPQQMLELGVFGGKYMTDCQKEFPRGWFVNAKLSPERANFKLNYYQVNASTPLWYWQAKGWINPDDPRGWFQWYCRYYQGRRHKDDQRQIKRWRQFRRHLLQLQKYCTGKPNCRRRQRQALLHWAYDSRQI